MRLTISAVFKKKILVKYWWTPNIPCNFSTPYCIIVCNLSSTTIYFHIISTGTIFGKKYTEQKLYVFIFLQLWPVTFHSLRTNQQCTILNVHRFSFQISKKTQFSQEIFGKGKIINFRENVYRRSVIFPRVPTNDTHDEANSLFRSFEKAPN